MADSNNPSLDQITGKVTNGAHAAAERAFTKGEELFKQGLDKSKERINQAVDMTATRVEEAQAFVTRQAREKPIQTTAIAAGAGILLGLFLAGRRR